MIDVERLLRDYRIPYATSGSSHCRPGWIQVHCPFCSGSQDWHLGYYIKGDRWNCWRCGGKDWERVSRTLTGQSLTQVRARYSRSALPGGSIRRSLARESKLRTRPLAKLPAGIGGLGPDHRRYLEEKRNFDSFELEKEWGLLGTGPLSYAVEGNRRWAFKQRIILPILWGGRIVTYQGRDITGKAPDKYKACPPELEARSIKHCLYGLEKVDAAIGCVVVEGAADVWRLGPGAVGTFGTQWVTEQASLLLRMKRVFLLFDSNEDAARKFSTRFCSLLVSAGVEVEELDLGEDETDPGALKQDDADHLMKEIGLR